MCPHRPEVDHAILAGGSYRTVGRQFGVSHSAVARHVANCLQPSAIELAASGRAEAVDLPDKVQELLATAEDLLAAARDAGQGAGMLAAMREARASIELLAKLSGQLRSGDTTTVNVILSEHPEWQRIRAAMTEALAPFPDAAAAVGEALRAVEANRPRAAIPATSTPGAGQ